jgi:putative CocE/NonD family hydrolase
MRRLHYSTVVSFGVALVLLLARVASPQGRPQILTDLKIPMSDGVALAADIYQPAKEGKYPVILIRTPYDKKYLEEMGAYFAEAGYITVIQDVRGQGNSEGVFIPFSSEKKDGTETVNWIVSQPWSDGKIGLWGLSYLAYNGFMILPARLPAVKSFVDISGFADLDEFMNPGGAFSLMAQMTWFMTQVGGMPLPPESVRTEQMTKIFSTRPLRSLFGDKAEGMEEAFQDISGEFDKIDIPVLHITGWHDFVYRNTLEAYEKIRKHGVEQALIIGPWHHDQELTKETKVGDEDFGPSAEMGTRKILDISKEWFDETLKGTPPAQKNENAVRIFVMGKNDWEAYHSWPPASADFEKWYFSSGKGANGSKGDGKLSLERPEKPSLDRFTSDPDHYVPTNGGANFHYYTDNIGVKNQADIEKRKDVLVYTSDVLKSPLKIIGPLKAFVYASMDTVDTDITVKIVELRADGYSRNIEDGIIRARYRKSLHEAEMLRPGVVALFGIDLGSTGIELAEGSRIRVEIAGSNFPKYDRNPNTGEEPMSAVRFIKANIEIHCSDEYPSHILLPVVRDGLF